MGQAGEGGLTARAIAAARVANEDLESIYTGREVARFSDALAAAPEPLRVEIAAGFDAYRRAFTTVAEAEAGTPESLTALSQGLAATQEAARRMEQAGALSEAARQER